MENETALKGNLLELEKQIADIALKIKELEEALTALQKNQMDSSYYQGMELTMLRQIIDAMPNIESKHSYIEGISDNGEITVKRVDMLDDDTMPNGYRLDDLGKMKSSN